MKHRYALAFLLTSLLPSYGVIGADFVMDSDRGEANYQWLKNFIDTQLSQKADMTICGVIDGITVPCVIKKQYRLPPTVTYLVRASGLSKEDLLVEGERIALAVPPFQIRPINEYNWSMIPTENLDLFSVCNDFDKLCVGIEGYVPADSVSNGAELVRRWEHAARTDAILSCNDARCYKAFYGSDPRLRKYFTIENLREFRDAPQIFASANITEKDIIQEKLDLSGSKREVDPREIYVCSVTQFTNFVGPIESCVIVAVSDGARSLIRAIFGFTEAPAIGGGNHPDIDIYKKVWRPESCGRLSSAVSRALKADPFVFDVVERTHVVKGAAQFRPSPILGGWREQILVFVELDENPDNKEEVFVQATISLLLNKQNTSREVDWQPANLAQAEKYRKILQERLQEEIDKSCPALGLSTIFD